MQRTFQGSLTAQPDICFHSRCRRCAHSRQRTDTRCCVPQRVAIRCFAHFHSSRDELSSLLTAPCVCACIKVVAKLRVMCVAIDVAKKVLPYRQPAARSTQRSTNTARNSCESTLYFNNNFPTRATAFTALNSNNLFTHNPLHNQPLPQCSVLCVVSFWLLTFSVISLLARHIVTVTVTVTISSIAACTPPSFFLSSFHFVPANYTCNIN